MTKRLRSISVFLTAWLFAFSLLSNCYCLPAFSSAPLAQPEESATMPAHCEHHSDATKQKKSDCSPRFNTDQFENTVIKARPMHAVAVDLPLMHATEEKRVFPQTISFQVEPFLDSSPPIYILVRSLLI